MTGGAVHILMVNGGKNMNHCLHGKVALISGCSQGLGYEAAKILAAHGADIFGISIGDDEQRILFIKW